MSSDDAPIRHIFRWDLDKTYLRTDFETIRDLIKTALQTPEDKVNVPGAIELIRELQRKIGGHRTLVTFISGSPNQMREQLEEKFALDGVEPDLFALKPTLQYILQGKFRAVRSQLGYKLERLLAMRAETPLAPETMFGDDAEQDAFIYSLYADLAADRLDLDHLLAILAEAEVYDGAEEAIAQRVAEVEHADTVRRIFIHLEEGSPPGRFWVFGPRLVPVVNYFQAAVILFADSTVDAGSVLRVAAGLIERYDYGLVDLANSFEDLMRRRHLQPEVVERLGDAMQRHPDADLLPEDFLADLLARARALAPRSSRSPREWSGPPDYLEVLRSDRRLRESVQEESGGLFN